MQYHPTTPTLIREPVVRAVALYAQERAAHSLREVVPGIYSLRYRHDTAGHADERIFLRAIAAHPTVARVDCTTAAEDELLGVDALLTLREGDEPDPDRCHRTGPVLPRLPHESPHHPAARRRPGGTGGDPERSDARGCLHGVPLLVATVRGVFPGPTGVAP